MSEKTLETLAGELARARREEDEAKSRRIQLEEEIAPLVETPENGSRTVDAGNGLKVTVKRGLNYKADLDGIQDLDIPDEIKPIKMIPASLAFDKNEYERVIKDHPDAAVKLAEFVTVTPSKVSVSLKIS